MIYRLEIENFYSIRDRQVLDLRLSDKAPRKPERFVPIYPDAADRVPKVIAAFGANGAGKTSLLRAFAFLSWFIKDSFQLPPEAIIPVAHFNDKESAGRPIRLAVSLGGATNLDGGDCPPASFGTYEYELVISSAGGTTRVARESLRHRIQGSRRSFRVFERNDRGEILDGENYSLARFRSVVEKVRPNASVISTLAQFDHVPSLTLRNAARSIFTNIFLIKQEYTDDQILTALATNQALLDALNREIPRVDLGIRSLQVMQGQLRPMVQFEHQGLDFAIPWPFESHGTQSFVRSFPLIAAALDSGGVAVIDELDASLHPLMLVEILRWFYDPQRNTKNAQLWITCQNASLLEELEKEEIVFCSKDSLGRTQVYGLQDIGKVRRVDNYYRKYLSGAYGALPAIG